MNSIQSIFLVMFSVLTLSCKDAEKDNKVNDDKSYLGKEDEVCTKNIDSLTIEVEKMVELKYGDIFDKNYSDNLKFNYDGMTLVDWNESLFYFKGSRIVPNNPDLDSLPQVIFNYNTCKVINIEFIKIKPYQKE